MFVFLQATNCLVDKVLGTLTIKSPVKRCCSLLFDTAVDW